MTIKECQEEHKKLWNWIADETEATGKPASKDDYFMYFGSGDPREWAEHCCFACEYAYGRDGYNYSVTCKNCPIDWDKIFAEKGELRWSQYKINRNLFCEVLGSEYRQWANLIRRWIIYKDEEELRTIISLARKIADYPFKEDDFT